MQAERDVRVSRSDGFESRRLLRKFNMMQQNATGLAVQTDTVEISVKAIRASRLRRFLLDAIRATLSNGAKEDGIMGKVFTMMKPTLPLLEQKLETMPDDTAIGILDFIKGKIAEVEA